MLLTAARSAAAVCSVRGNARRSASCASCGRVVMARPTRSARHATPARTLPVVVGRFVRTEASSGIVLVAAAVTALVWANSPWQGSYESLWHSDVHVAFGVF